MAISYLSPINLNQQEIQNVRLQNLATDVSSPVEGQIWENTTTHRSKIYDGSVIQTFVYLTDPLSSLAPPTSSLSMNNQTITNLGTPVNPTDAATKQYVDQSELGLDVKASVVAATTQAATLATSFANGSVIDGVTLATGNRILVKNQTNGAENGIYVVAASGAPTRSTDCNSSSNYLTGAFTFVEQGTVNQGGAWVVNTQGTITPGTTSVTWVQFFGASSTSTNLAGGVLGSLPYQSGASTTAFLAGNTAATDQVLVSHGTGSTAAAPTLTNAPALSATNFTNFPTLNQSTTGNAATATTAANIAGGALGSVPYQSGSGATALVSPNTTATAMVLTETGTGTVGAAPVFSNAPAISATNIPVASFPTLNQSTTGNAATATTATNVAGGVTGSIHYQSATGTTAMLAPNTAATDQVLVSHGTGSAGAAPTLSNAPALSAANFTNFPTLNQNTTGNAATATLATSATNLAGGTTDAIPYQSAAGTTAFLAANTTATAMVLVSTGTGSAAQAPTLTNAPALSAANFPVASFPTLNQNTTGTAAGLSVTLAISSGGTGATTAAGARANLGCTTKYAAAVGDGVSTSIVVTHGLGTQDVHVGLYLAASPYNVVIPDVQITSTTTITLNFSTAPTTGQYRVVVIG